MQNEDKDASFVQRRAALVKRWPIVGGVLLTGIALVLGFLWYRSPLLVNPWNVASRLKADSLGEPTLMIMASLLPLMFLVCFLLLTSLVLYQFAAMHNEKRLLRIIESLTSATLTRTPKKLEVGVS